MSRPLRVAAWIVLTLCGFSLQAARPASPPSAIRFELKTLPFKLEISETSARNAPEPMAGGVAVFDYNGDGRSDIFFTNDADIATLKKNDLPVVPSTLLSCTFTP